MTKKKNQSFKNQNTASSALSSAWYFPEMF